MKKVYFSAYIKEVLTVPEMKEESRYRYGMEIKFRNPKSVSRAIVIMKNPSMAGIKEKLTGKILSDDTVYKVCDYLYKSGFSSVNILNLFPIFGPTFKNIVIETPEQLIGETLNSDCNNQVIIQAIDSINLDIDKIILAWGGYPDLYKRGKPISSELKATVMKLYDDRISEVLKIIGDKPTYMVGDKLRDGLFPPHGKMWYDYEKLKQIKLPV